MVSVVGLLAMAIEMATGYQSLAYIPEANYGGAPVENLLLERLSVYGTTIHCRPLSITARISCHHFSNFI
jgi:hypothetical protein